MRLRGSRPAERGLTMVELLVGLVISSLIIVGSVFVYSQSRTTQRLNETHARLQEYGRYAISILEPDIQLAGYYGFSNNPLDFRLIDGDKQIPVSQLEQVDSPYRITGLEVAHACGPNFIFDLAMSVQGTDNTYGLSCAPNGGAGTAVAGTDTLTIRRASTTAVEPNDGRVQLYANSLKRVNQFIFWSEDGEAPGVIDSTREVRNLIVRTYYISQNSDGMPGMPSLRRKHLGTSESGAPAIIDEEILPGVEDLQVQFGIDTGDHNGIAGIDVDDDNNGIPDNVNGLVSRYVDPGDPLLFPPTAANPAGRRAQVVAVRIWLRIRAEQPDPAFTDTRTYKYAGVEFTPTGADAHIRRALVSRTIYLRNARSL
ncbi:MAG TPA: PilW family protein [Steroidobacteraceae bacterium]